MKLQGIGEVASKQAQDVEVGDVLVWNYGSTSRVEGIVKATAKFVTLAIRCENGELYERRLMKTRQVGIA